MRSINMSELFQPNDEVNEIAPTSRKGEGPLLRPIDEAEDFYDPFSDLNLFLSKKIRTEVQEIGCITKWSGKIEANLLAKILPEFKQKFPKYRLGAAALKKVWEKVAYYYEKIQGQKGALQTNGTLNLKFMIRENLKTNLSPYHLPPYTVAEQIATKLSECMASFEGKKMEINHLTKVIWSVQKHLIRNLSAIQSKNPYEEYDRLDKLIVKAILEITTLQKDLSPNQLKQKVIVQLASYSDIADLLKKSQLTSTLSMLLARKLYPNSSIARYFSTSEKSAIEDFIRYQIKVGRCNTLLAVDEHHLELIQRILALYTLAEEVPRGIGAEELRSTIQQINRLNTQGRCAVPSHIDQSLFVFINAEIHLMSEKKLCGKEGEEAILAAYQKACTLPKLSPRQVQQFELLVWKVIEEEGSLLLHIPSQLIALLEKEIGNVLIDNPKQSFRMITNNALQFFKKVLQTPIDQKSTENKVETWATQGDMLVRTVHFDSQTPLLQILQRLWREEGLEEHSVDHDGFIARVLQKACAAFPQLTAFQTELQARLWILYKYLWYTAFSDGTEPTYHRFLLWHSASLRNKHPHWTEDKLNEHLSTISEQLLPLFPFAQIS